MCFVWNYATSKDSGLNTTKAKGCIAIYRQQVNICPCLIANIGLVDAKNIYTRPEVSQARHVLTHAFTSLAV